MRSCIVFIFVLMFAFEMSAQTASQNMKNFLLSCGWGTLIGASVGVASLAFENRPEEKMGNIARGASLGLYAGIGIGLWSIHRESHEQLVVRLSRQTVARSEVSNLEVAFRF